MLFDNTKTAAWRIVIRSTDQARFIIAKSVEALSRVEGFLDGVSAWLTEKAPDRDLWDIYCDMIRIPAIASETKEKHYGSERYDPWYLYQICQVYRMPIQRMAKRLKTASMPDALELFGAFLEPYYDESPAFPEAIMATMIALHDAQHSLARPFCADMADQSDPGFEEISRFAKHMLKAFWPEHHAPTQH